MRRIAALALLCVGCGPTARVDVYLEAEPDLAARATAIAIRVEDTSGVVVFDESTSLADRSLPVAVRLEPSGGDAARTFLVVARLVDGAGVIIARVAARGGYVAGETRELRLRFEAGCDAGLACDGATTCRDGACVDACAAELGGCGDPDGGAPDLDAGDLDAGARDAGDFDAAVHVAAYVTRSVARFDTSDAATWRSALGSAERIETGDRAWIALVSAALNDGSARLLVDGVEVALGATPTDAPSGPGPFSAFALLPSGGAHTVDVELQARVMGTTASLRDVSLVAFPLPAGTAVQVDEALADSFQLQSAEWQTRAEVRFTPATSGRHLVLAAVSATPAPALDTVSVRVLDGTGAHWPAASGSPPHLAGASDERQTFFLARAPMLAGGAEASFAVQVRAGSPSSNTSHARVIAFDLAGFAATRHDEQLPAGSTSAGSPMVLASVNAPAGPVRDWIVIGSVALLSAGTRGASLRVGDLEHRYQHAFSGDARLSYPGVFALATGEPFTASSAAFGAGASVEHREAVVHALALP